MHYRRILFLFAGMSLFFFQFMDVLHKCTLTTVEGEIKWNERKTHRTSSRGHDGCSPLIAMQPPVQCIGRIFSTNGMPAAFRTMVQPNRLIKLNRANESRANPAWGMQCGACVCAHVPFVRLQTSSCMVAHCILAKSHRAELWEYIVQRGRHNGVANLMTITNRRRSTMSWHL